VENLVSNQAKYSQDETNAILIGATPLIKKYARYYAWYYYGFGVEYEDLFQDGILAVLSLMESRERENLDHGIRTCLRGMIRDASERTLRQGCAERSNTPPESDDGSASLEESVPDKSAEEDTRRVEIMHDIKRCLDERNYEIAVMLLEERSLAEIGRALGITKQAVANRVKKIRTILEHMKR